MNGWPEAFWHIRQWQMQARIGGASELVAHGAALAAAGQARCPECHHRVFPACGPIRRLNPDRQIDHGRARSGQSQNASAGSSIMLAAPAWMRARCAPVSGSMRSMKKRPVTSFAVMRSSAPAASFACAASAMRHHM